MIRSLLRISVTSSIPTSEALTLILCDREYLDETEWLSASLMVCNSETKKDKGEAFPELLLALCESRLVILSIEIM